MQLFTESAFFPIFVTLLTLSVLVAVHEAGHFIVARWCGVKVLRFSIGFGKPLLRKIGKDGTEYVLAVLPLGGYVRMLDGRNDTFPEAFKQFAFNHQSVYRRIAIVAAGPLINLLFAALLYAGVQYVGVPQLSPVINHPIPVSAAAQVGMEQGQKIVAINGQEVQSWQEVNLQLFGMAGETTSIDVRVQPLDVNELQDQALVVIEERGEQALPKVGMTRGYTLAIENWLQNNTETSPAQQLGWYAWQPRIPAKIGSLVDGGPAQLANLQEGDLITYVNSESVSSYGAFVQKVRGLPKQAVTVHYMRNGETRRTLVNLQSHTLTSGEVVGFIGIGVQPVAWPNSIMQAANLSVFESVFAGVKQTLQMIGLSLKFVRSMVFGEVSVDHVSGPISIAKVAASSAAMGWITFVTFMAYLSVSLGVLNLLPIPMLDGGHLMYYLFELVTGKPVPDKVQRLGLRIGMGFILLITFVALSNDIARF